MTKAELEKENDRLKAEIEALRKEVKAYNRCRRCRCELDPKICLPCWKKELVGCPH